jgi:sodium/potassium-transporting ATPase subunit alpha
MVLLDSFAGVVETVKYGRVVFDNSTRLSYIFSCWHISGVLAHHYERHSWLTPSSQLLLMIIICCLTDCAAATVLAYEKPEADVLLWKPRNPKKDKLVDWKLLFHAYIFFGVQETVLPFTMAYVRIILGVLSGHRN